MTVLDILNSPWAIVPERYTQIRDIYERHASGEKIDIAAAEERLGRKLENDYRSLTIDGGVAVLSVQGVLAKRMNLFTSISGGSSYQLMQRDFMLAMKDPEVHSVLLLIDSPGGEVSGTEEFSNQIFEARGRKPIVAVCEGSMSSAAYWIGCAADDVYVSSFTDQVGSIGVVCAHRDISGAEAKGGVKVTEITAGKYKRVASEHAPLTDAGQAELQAFVDQIYTVFVNAVARNRNVSVEKVLSDMADGRTFVGQRAVDVGLVDGQRTAIQAVQQLQQDRQKLLYPTRSASALTSGGPTMETPAVVPTATDIEVMRKRSHDDGYKAGADAERARIQAVEAQAMPGHEELIGSLKFDGKTSGAEAAVQVLAAEKKKLGDKATALRTDAGKAAANSPTESTVAGASDAAVDASSSPEEITARAEQEWAANPKLLREFGNKERYISFRKAEARGLVRVKSDRKTA